MPKLTKYFRISLLSFLLIVTLICVVVSHYELSRDNLVLRQQVADLNDTLGDVNVEDPDRIYMRRLESLDALTWRFRLYLPPKRTYMLRMKGRQGGSGRSLRKFEKPFTITFGFRKQPDSTWKLNYTMPSSAGSGGADSDTVERMIAADVVQRIRGDTQEFASDSDVELVRFGEDEFRIWIEPWVRRDR